MAAFPTTVATDADLYIAVNAKSTQLTDNPLTIGATTVNVVSTTGFPTVGFISIDNEIIKYTGTTATSFTGCTRGADGTAASSHVQNSQVFHNVIAAHHNAPKDEIIATQQFISDVIGRENTKIKLPDGSVTNPSSTFAAQTGLGFYRAGSNRIGVAFAGTLGLDINFTTGYLDFTGNMLLALSTGTVGAPSLSHRNLATTGWYFPTTLSHTFTVGSSPVATLRAENGVDLGLYLNRGYLKFGTASGNGGDGTAAAPIGSWESDPDTGFFRAAANCFAIAANGIEYLRIGVTGSSGAIASNAVGGFSNTISSAGNLAIFYAEHTDNTNSASHSVFQMTTGGANGGSPYLGFSITGQNNWTMGAKNNDDDDFVIINSSNFAGAAPLFRIDRSTQSAQFAGTNTNDNAPIGWVGEYLEASQTTATNTPASGTFGDAVSISLTAGDWDLSATITHLKNTATWTAVFTGISSTSGNSAVGLTQPINFNVAGWASSGTTPEQSVEHITNHRVSISATTTYYLKVRATYSAGQPQYLAFMRARRVR